MARWRHLVTVPAALAVALAASLTAWTPTEASIHEIIAAACRAGGEEVRPPGQTNAGRPSFLRALQATGFITSIDTSDPSQVVVHFDPTIPASKFTSAGVDLLIPDGFGPGVALVLSPLIVPDKEFAAHTNCRNLSP
jgi:hypothetical protein